MQNPKDKPKIRVSLTSEISANILDFENPPPKPVVRKIILGLIDRKIQSGYFQKMAKKAANKVIAEMSQDPRPSWVDWNSELCCQKPGEDDCCK